MNIGIVVPYFTPFVRGNEYGLAQSLSDSGHNITIIATTARAPREKMLTDAAWTAKLDFNIEYLPVLIDIGDNPISFGIEKHVRGQDVILLQEDYPLVCHSAYNAARKYGIPAILSSERTYYPENTIKRYALKVLDTTTNKKLRDSVDVITAHCTAAKEFMMRELAVNRKISVIHVGVDIELFKPVSSGEKYLIKGEYRILTTARLHKYKGLTYLIEAMKIIKEEIPQAHLYILGKGHEELTLRDLVKKLKLGNAVTFLTTSIPNHEMPSLYAECDVYAQPSLIEPYGIAVLEAMACGKPVVGTKVGGMRDTISEGETGFLVDPRDPQTLAKRIIKLSDQKLCKEIGMNARKKVLEKFDWRFIASKYLEIIDAIR